MALTAASLSDGAPPAARRPRARRLLAAGLSACLVGAAWFVFAPSQLGGSVSYVVIQGQSMEPRLHRGDLAILRHSSGYEVGEIVAYRSRELGGRIVLHRILRRSGDRYVLKGDNNSFVDPTRPAAGDMVGKMWIRMPGAGNALDWVRTPRNAAALAFLLGLLTFGGHAGTKLHRRRRDHVEGQGGKSGGLTPRHALAGPAMRTVVTGLLGAVAAFALLGVVAFTRPTERTATWPRMYRHAGTFSYSASAPRGPVYPDGKVETGEPIFLRLVRRVAVRFDYRLESEADRSLFGETSLAATLSGANLGTRTIRLEGSRSFSGNRATLDGTLDLRALQALGAEAEEITGSRSDSYLVTIAPEIRVAGTVAGREVNETFAPQLAMRLDPVALRVESPIGPASPNARLTRSKAVAGMRDEAGTVSLMGLALDVKTARRAALAGGLGSLGGALLLALVLALRRRGGDEPGRIEAEFGSLLVGVAPRDRRAASVVEVATIDQLVKLANHYDRVILHEQRADGHAYLVEEGGVVYCYAVGPVRGDRLSAVDEDTLVPSLQTAPDAPEDVDEDVGYGLPPAAGRALYELPLERRSRVSVGSRLRGLSASLSPKSAASRR